jgi:phosphatidylinositol alpha-mannosyltransferase
LPEPDRKPGGVDVFVDSLANRLAWRGLAVTVFSYSSAPRGSAYGYVRLSPAAYAHSKLARLTLVPLALNRLETSALDVLHLHGDDWFFTSRHVPTVRTFHGSALHEARTATGMKRRLSQTVTFGLEIVASRLATASYMGAPDQGRAYRPSGVLPYAVNVPTEATTTRTGTPIVLFVGTWGGRKRGRLLYEAFQREVLPRVPNAELHMVSDECPHGPSSTWWDRPDRAQLDELYRRAWVFCLPSSYEGFGLPYAEAMAAGTPVVATPNPGAEYVLDGGHSGLIVAEDQLGRRLAELLTNEPLRSRFASAGRAKVEDFSWETAADAHEHAYEEAIANWAARRSANRGPRSARRALAQSVKSGT